jgi:hypothetical protein
MPEINIRDGVTLSRLALANSLNRYAWRIFNSLEKPSYIAST